MSLPAGIARRLVTRLPQARGGDAPVWLACVMSLPMADGELPHCIGALWAPDAQGLWPRLPEITAIGSPDAPRTLAELLARAPAEPRFLLTDHRVVDMALACEVQLAADPHLQHGQRSALSQLRQALRERDTEVIAQSFTHFDAGFARFTDALGLNEGGTP
ncbi:hypothetical protein [Piscinibacterium candidicorallinum]|uniref:Uncharacterized protein n=1 Tax=Piscinibacterium candidicorallinum TaxID=1793872 RepID=A0ABV7H528_9BURK|nr:hypothetical protein [Burkholderiaceae bacterium]